MDGRRGVCLVRELAKVTLRLSDVLTRDLCSFASQSVVLSLFSGAVLMRLQVNAVWALRFCLSEHSNIRIFHCQSFILQVGGKKAQKWGVTFQRDPTVTL